MTSDDPRAARPPGVAGQDPDAASTVDPPEWRNTLAALDPIERAEADATSALQTRVDRKYLLDVTDLVDLGGVLPAGTFLVSGEHGWATRYESVYFDSPDRRLHRDAAHSRRRRFKLRTRRYGNDPGVHLEVKTRSGRGLTVKARRTITESDHIDQAAVDFAREYLGPSGTAVRPVSAVLAGSGWVDTGSREGSAAPVRRRQLDLDELKPALTTRYVRVTIVNPNAGFRATFDHGVNAVDVSGRTATIDRVVVETKSAGAATSLDRTLWRLGRRPVRFSKYSVALAALDPELPSNKWHRVLGRVSVS